MGDRIRQSVGKIDPNVEAASKPAGKRRRQGAPPAGEPMDISGFFLRGFARLLHEPAGDASSPPHPAPSPTHLNR